MADPEILGMRPVLCLLLASLASAGESCPLTNHKSDIALAVSGVNGTDWVFERWYHDPLIDDHGVIYLKADARISLSRKTGDDGAVIRYKIDRDLGYRGAWSLRFNKIEELYLLPAYTEPLSFAKLTYAPERPDLPVLGTTGPNPGTRHEMSRASYFDHWYTGLRDAAGDEWHSLTVGTDASVLMESGKIKDRSENMRLTGANGKIHHLIVNPTTPAIWFSVATPEAQWYTTPAKAYFIPILHEQTTYVTDGVRIALANIMSDKPVHYRFDAQPFAPYRGPIDVATLTDGPHVLECWYDEGRVRRRAIVKNPPFPSDRDRFADGGGHGRLVWKDAAELDAIRARLQDGSTPVRKTLKARYELLLKNGSEYGSGRDWFEKVRGKGDRIGLDANTFPFINAFIVKLKGLADSLPHARAAKAMLLENELSIDPVGYELDMNFMCVPSHTARTNLGYYKGRGYVALAHAYDLLIMDYRAPRHAGGFTPIEDLKVRDLLASFILLSLHDRQGQLCHLGMGISMVSRSIASLVGAMAMPSYDTPYYGTSGFDGTAASHAWVPFPDQQATWKELFYLDSVPSRPYPNQVFKLGMLSKETLGFTMPGLKKSGGDATGTYGNIKEDGMSAYGQNSIAYNSFALMGFMFGVYSNTLRLHPGHGQDLAYLDRYFVICHEGRQPPDPIHKIPIGLYPNPLVCNARHPGVADLALRVCFASDWDPIKGISSNVPYYFVWVDDQWQATAK